MDEKGFTIRKQRENKSARHEYHERFLQLSASLAKAKEREAQIDRFVRIGKLYHEVLAYIADLEQKGMQNTDDYTEKVEIKETIERSIGALELSFDGRPLPQLLTLSVAQLDKLAGMASLVIRGLEAVQHELFVSEVGRDINNEDLMH